MKKVSQKIIRLMKEKKLSISFAESCTGGLIASTITSISGASKVFNLGLVTYSNNAKIKALKIPKNIIKKHGSVSKEVCKAMAKNVAQIGNTKMSVSITGIAGPTGGTKNKPVGLVYIGIKHGKKININKFLFKNEGRTYIRKTTVNKCLKLILDALK